MNSRKQRNIKEQLLYQTSLLEAQKEATPDGILIVDQNGKIITYNKRFIDMWKIPQEIIEKKDDKAALDFVISQVSDPEGFIKRVAYLYAHPQISRDEIVFKNGQIFDRYSAPVKGKNDEYFGYAWYFRDITQQKSIERQKDEFLAIASHELKTPMTSIKIYCHILLASFRHRGDIDAVDKLSKLYGQISKLTKLIGDLLDVSKVKGGELEFSNEYFDFNQLIEEVVEEMRMISEKHKIIKKLSQTATVYGDRDRMAQVLTNLLSNAIKYSPDAKKVIISTEITNGTVILCVQDFGVGISREEQRKIFKRFFRVNEKNSIANTFPGLGLGLYISREIIKRQGGKIWVESVKGKGSKFYFSLPTS